MRITINIADKEEVIQLNLTTAHQKRFMDRLHEMTVNAGKEDVSGVMEAKGFIEFMDELVIECLKGMSREAYFALDLAEKNKILKEARALLMPFGKDSFF